MENNLRKILIDSGIRLLENNLVQGTWGNSSYRLDDHRMLISPSGLDYLSLKEEDMVIVDINTLEREGGLKPSSEKGVHAGVYQNRKDINAIIHTHPIYCSVLAATRKGLPCLNEEMKQLIGGDVKVANYGLPGTGKLSKMTIKGMEGRNACFMANHGVLCAGKDMEEAFQIIKFLEEACKTYIEQKTLELTGEKVFTEQLLDNYFLNHKTKC